jgi:hypothetical protein
MKSASLRLKHLSGWFAAGREVAEALTLLSDAGFKLFVWLCLHADRSRGALRVESQEMARVLGKTEAEIATLLEDLFQKEICHGADGWIVVADRFWPYQRLATAPPVAGAEPYVARVKQLMLQRACIRTSFTAADQKLALQLHQDKVPIERVERAIHLGCLRKYVALLNHQGGTLITSLHYFTLLFEEVEKLDISQGYWRYTAFNVEKLERQWRLTRPASSLKQLAAKETK